MDARPADPGDERGAARRPGADRPRILGALRWLGGPTGRRTVVCAFTGFSSGLPLYVLIQLVPFWLREGGVSLRDIGFLSLVLLPYSWKFLWSPLLDRYGSPLGRRRGWMLLTQILLLAGVSCLGLLRPEPDLDGILLLCLLVGLFSATQDVALDAFRRELLPDRELGLGNAVHVQAYRIAGLVPGSLALILADALPWSWVFPITGAFMALGVGLTLAVREPPSSPPRTLRDAVVLPFREFVSRNGWRWAALVLAFIFFYKLGDNMATALSTPFYQDLGFTGIEIGTVAKWAGLLAAVAGALFGGVLMLWTGINRALWIFGVVQMVTILGFAALAEVGHSTVALAVVVALEYLGVGLGTAAFVAFIARSATPALAATQIALLTSIAAQPRAVASALTGFLVEGGDPARLAPLPALIMQGLLLLGVPAEGLGWTRFFLLCTALAVPGMVLLAWVAPWGDDPQKPEPEPTRDAPTSS